MANDPIAAEFQKTVLAPLVAELAEKQEELKSKSIIDFGMMVNDLLIRAKKGFLEVVGLGDWKDLNVELMTKFVGYSISGLNSSLPVDYPYIVSALDIADEKGLRFFCLERKLIPGMHDLLSRNIVPVCFVKSKKDVAQGKINIDKAQFLSGDEFDEA
jgi:hypothetical protein